MKRMIRAAVAAAMTLGTISSIGCMADRGDRPSMQDRYSNWVDPCWPDRYSHEARESVITPFAAHVENGKVLDNTLFNYYFEPASDKLTPAGAEKLDSMARRRPAPDSRVYIQASRDVPFDAAAPEKYVSARNELDAKRTEAVQKYWTATLAGRSAPIDISIIDPGDMTQSAVGPAAAARSFPRRFGLGTPVQVVSTEQTGAGGGGAPPSGGAPPPK